MSENTRLSALSSPVSAASHYNEEKMKAGADRGGEGKAKQVNAGASEAPDLINAACTNCNAGCADSSCL